MSYGKLHRINKPILSLCFLNHYTVVVLGLYIFYYATCWSNEYTTDTVWCVIYISVLHKRSAHKIVTVGIRLLETNRDVCYIAVYYNEVHTYIVAFHYSLFNE